MFVKFIINIDCYFEIEFTLNFNYSYDKLAFILHCIKSNHYNCEGFCTKIAISCLKASNTVVIIIVES